MSYSSGATTVAEVIGRRDDEPEVDPNADVLIKAESHYSTQDLREELALLRTNEFDAVVFEGAREDAEEITKSSIFNWIIGLVFFVMGPLYNNNTPLLSASGRTETVPYYTREKNGDVIQDLSPPFPALIASLWVLCLVITALFGIAEGGVEIAGTNITYSAVSFLFFLIGFGLPVIVRIVRNQIGGELNRNAVIARKIQDANSESGRTLVILGNKHAQPVEQELPDEIDASVVPVSHSLMSADGMKIFVPGVLKVVLLFGMVWLFIKTVGGPFVLLLFSLLV